MGLFLKIFAGFWIIWILWYVTGGPLRDTKDPYVRFTGDGTIVPVSTSTTK